MFKKILYIISILTVYHCQAQGDKNENQIEAKIVANYLSSNGTKPISKDEFNKRCIDLFGIDLSKNHDEMMPLNDSEYYILPSVNLVKTFSESLFYNPNIEGKVSEKEAENLLKNKENGMGEKFVNYNMLLFNDNPSTIPYFLKNPEYLKEVVLYFDYERNDILSKKFINSFDFRDLDEKDTSHLLFYNNSDKKIKTALLQKIKDENDINDIFEISYFLTKYYDNLNVKDSLKKEASIFILNVLNQYDKTQNYTTLYEELGYQFYSNLIEKDDDFGNYLFQNHYFNNDEFKRLSKSYENLKNTDSEEISDFFKTTIQDPDGYTNLRQSANNQSKIIQQIKSGEEINILGKQDNWYYIQTQNGNKGYVHKSRVQFQ